MPASKNPDLPSYRQPTCLATAVINWQQWAASAKNQQQPEVTHLFLKQNNLPERWKHWHQQRAFVMAEKGFGTGLNLLIAMDFFLKTAPATARLHWISTQTCPLTPEDLQKAHTFLPELAEYAALLQKNYPLAISGFHRLNLHPRVTVDLLLGDERINLKAVDAKIDAWCETATQGIEKASTVNQPATQKHSIAIIGAGLSGLCTAQALIKRGFKVAMYEEKVPAAGGSGNRQGALYIKLSVDANQSSRFYLAGLEYSRRWLEALDPKQQLWSPSGVLQLAITEQEAKRQQRFIATQNLPKTLVTAVDKTQASALAGSQTSAGGLFFSRTGWVTPKALCDHLAQTLDGLTLYPHQAVIAINSHEKGWQLETAKGNQVYQQVIICCAAAAKRFTPSQWLPVKSVRGQVSYLALDQSSANKPKVPFTVVCGKGYTLPPMDNTLCFGATFDSGDTNTAMSQVGQQQNQQALDAILPNLLTQLSTNEPTSNSTGNPLNGRVSFRCAAPDHLPLVGRLPKLKAWQENYRLTQAKVAVSDFPSEWQHLGLWLNIGHGSRGLTSIPIAAELLASQLADDSAPFEKELVDCLNPARFILRELRRKQD